MTKRSSLLMLFTSFLLTSSLASAQSLDLAFGPFVPFGELQATLDGKPLDASEMYHAERPGVYLLRSPGLEQPILINVRSQTLEHLRAEAIRDNSNGTVNLLAGAIVATIGPFQVEGNQLTSTLDDGRRLTFSHKPALLGPQTANAIRAHDVSYGYRAGLYPPSTEAISQLRQETRQVKVIVFFGSWCSTCARVLPWILAVEQALGEGNISFVYYGLPHTMDDSIIQQEGIKGVPTAIVRVGGKELGRRSSNGLGIPEEALLEMLANNRLSIMTTPKTRQPKRSFAPGPPLANSAELLAWFQANSAAYVRIPAVILFSQDRMFGRDTTFIGTEAKPPDDDAIVLDLDDSALGISLSSRLDSLCDAESKSCVVWIEGSWGRLMPAFQATEPPPWPMTVRDVGPLVEGLPLTILVAVRFQ